MITLRPYQQEIADKGKAILQNLGIVYLAMEVRTGKTITALSIAVDKKRVLFITKKKAISSIEDDYNALAPNYELEVVNYESIHKVKGNFDLLIIDEAHRIGSFPKPSKAAKQIKERWSHLPMILLSGTPTPETYSQIYHQFWVSQRSPFLRYTNFYKWSKVFVSVKKKHFAHGVVNDYSGAKENLIKREIHRYMISYTQAEAGFTSKVNEHIVYVDMPPTIKFIINHLSKHSVLEGKTDTILADTGVKLKQKIHQLCGGSCIGESSDIIQLSDFKAKFIKSYFQGYKIAIFYKYKGDFELLKKVFKDEITNDLEEFNTTDKHIALQIQSGREGISLSKADKLVYYSIDFSAVSYWQSRDRLTTKDRSVNDVYWIFTSGGIENSIYKVVQDKKDYTLSHFQNDRAAISE